MHFSDQIRQRTRGILGTFSIYSLTLRLFSPYQFYPHPIHIQKRYSNINLRSTEFGLPLIDRGCAAQTHCWYARRAVAILQKEVDFGVSGFTKRSEKLRMFRLSLSLNSPCSLAALTDERALRNERVRWLLRSGGWSASLSIGWELRRGRIIGACVYSGQLILANKKGNQWGFESTLRN